MKTKTQFFVICASLLACISLPAGVTRYEGWTPRADDHVLFTKEFPPVGSGEIKEKFVVSYWCSKESWKAQPTISSLEDIEATLSIADAIELAKERVDSKDLGSVDFESVHCEYIIVPVDSGSTSSRAYRFFYYIHFPSKKDHHIRPGVVVLADKQVRLGMGALTPGSNSRWEIQSE